MGRMTFENGKSSEER